MSDDIALGEGCFVGINTAGNVSLIERYPDQSIVDVVNFPPEQMDKLCKWWAERRELVTVSGTRFSLSQVLAQFACGDSINTLADEFDMNQEAIRNLLLRASEFLKRL